MPSPSELVDAVGGLAPKAALALSDHQLTLAVRSGELTRVRRGWYATLPSSDPRVRAATIGGRVTGAARLRLAGAWMWEEPPLEVSVRHNTARLGPIPPGVQVHYDPDDVVRRGRFGLVDLEDAFVHAVRSVTFEEAVSALDWALHTGHLEARDIDRLARRLPRRIAPVVDWADDSCESFIESIVRTRLRLGGHSVTSQVQVGQRQRIDLVVDGLVAVEVDGREFHEGSFEEDRRKDLAITREGKYAIRLTYALIRHEWPRVLAAIEAALAMRRQPTARPPILRVRSVLRGNRRGNWSMTEDRRVG